MLRTMALNTYRIVNSTIFSFLLIVLFCLIVISPVDAIYQCYTTKRLINIFFVAGAYIITFLLALLIYASRILTNRSVLTGIPKAWIPVEKEDVSKSVRRLVVEGFARSAIVASQARPRDITSSSSAAAAIDGGEEEGVEGDNESLADYKALLVDRERPPWGHVEHPGWSSPSSPDLPNLPYRTVMQELPHLIEAKAVSLAPTDPLLSLPHPFGQSVPDTRVVEVLQRPASMGLREYIQHLASLGLIHPPEVAGEFVALYEQARFSSRQLYEAEFRELMHVFAEILRGMKSLSVQMVEEIIRGEDGGGSGIGNTNGSLRADTESVIGPSDEEGETDAAEFNEDASVRRGRGRSHVNITNNNQTNNSLRPSNASFNDAWIEEEENRPTTSSTQSLDPRVPTPTTSTVPRNRGRGHHNNHSRLTVPRTPSTQTLQQLQRVRSDMSGSSTSAGSVVHLVPSPGPLDLPYTIDTGHKY